MNHRKNFLVYCLKFALVFCLAYFGTLTVIALSAPAGTYSPFIHNYLDYVSWLKYSLVHGSRWLLSLFNYATYQANEFSIRVKNGSGVRIEYDCVGYGVMSFWLAFIVANKGGWLKKMKWIVGGWFLIWCINVVRISMVLVAANKHWQFPFGLDHHTWFTIAAYILIFIMIYFYDRSFKEKLKTQKNISQHGKYPQNLMNDHNRY